MNYTRGDLLVVYWRDAVGCDRWTSIQLIEAEQPPLAKSVGWFLSEDDGCVRLLPSVVGNEAGYTVIPRGMIERIEVVRVDEVEVPEREGVE